MVSTDDAPVTVRLLRAPVALWAESEIYYSDMMREFEIVLIASREPGGIRLPPALVEVMEQLTGRFASARATPRPERDAAEAAGAEFVDVVYQVPRSAGADVGELGRLLIEADEMARSSRLLTLTASPQTWAFNRWYVEEFVRQAAGGQPRPWPEAAGEAIDPS